MKVDRLVSIIMILLDKKRISAQELAEMFEVSKRTIYRDIDSINMAGIPIRSTSGVGGGFEIMQQYKMDNKIFSTSDLSAIMMGLSSLTNMVEGNKLINTLAKVKSFIPVDSEKEIDQKTSQVYIDLNPWLGNSNIQPYLEIIKSAIQESNLLYFNYIDGNGNKVARTVEPYQLVLKKNHWYLQGYSYHNDDFCLFKLSHMSDLQMEEETFTPRKYQKPQTDTTDIMATMQTKIKLRIHKSVMDKVLDYCTYDHFTPDGEDHYIVVLPFTENDYYYNVLFTMGNKCECLEPLHIREEIKRRIHDIAALYED